MVKPIPIHHTTQALYPSQEAQNNRETETAQTQIAVPETAQTIKSEFSETASNQQNLNQQASELTNQEPGPGSIEKALQQLNEKMKPWATGIRFEVDPELDRLVVSIVDNDSGEVLRTIPSEALLQVAKMITTFQGQSINTRA